MEERTTKCRYSSKQPSAEEDAVVAVAADHEQKHSRLC